MIDKEQGIRTIREACRQGSFLLGAKDSRNKQDADHVCEMMMMHLLGWTRSQLYLDWNDPFPVDRSEVWAEMLQRKKNGEPVQYIIGEAEFYGRTFEVNEAVLIPRPETELLIDAVVKQAAHLWEANEAIVTADVGTGSGAIPITIAKRCANWRVHASDISDAALAVAKRNATRHHVDSRIQWWQGDLLQPWLEANEGVDVLISNPPYIPSSDLADLQTEVRDFEPMLALDGGQDGLDLYRRLVQQMSKLVRQPRLIAFEVGQHQANDVANFIGAAGDFRMIETIRDLSGIERHVIAWR